MDLLASFADRLGGIEIKAGATGAQNGIASVRENSTNPSRYDRRVNSAGKDCFVLTAANRQVIGVSEPYSSKAAMEKGIEPVGKTAPGAETVDLT